MLKQTYPVENIPFSSFRDHKQAVEPYTKHRNEVAMSLTTSLVAYAVFSLLYQYLLKLTFLNE